ncbi:hypothetical protein HanRHA438_Chr14g0647131 [Helianthus annuus]|uniref:Uncharacterized protein n=1 Tax=Helianthus annuus TaxID=4232 RepID=A0A9K3H5N4_HELAN|nr:hypothetical protein HanXRQr2_Chr14g0636561 [Helianthus annuus]KAJ0839747.1 hypothetical protein HanPSC8_Chr14g0610501 [Helianthus annuus]KAJ0853085.1 hypothetical protein HanRHA438_Chr14g0647131 [Helianthus annuus]
MENNNIFILQTNITNHSRPTIRETIPSGSRFHQNSPLIALFICHNYRTNRIPLQVVKLIIP